MFDYITMICIQSCSLNAYTAIAIHYAAFITIQSIHFIDRFHVDLKDVLNYTPEYDLKYDSIPLITHSKSAYSMVPGKLSRSLQVHTKLFPGIPQGYSQVQHLSMLSQCS